MRLAFALVHGFPVDVHRGSDVRMPHKFLLHFDRSSGLIEQGPESVAKRVPADASESATKACGRDMPLLNSPGIPRPPACLERARKYPILGAPEWCLLLPFPKHLGERRIERNTCVRVFGFDVAHDAVYDRSSHKQREILPENITPLECEKLAATEPRREIKDNHRAKGFVELSKQTMALCDLEHLRLARPFARAPHPHEFHRVLADVDELPTHRAVPEHAHEIVDVSPSSRSHVQSPQPLLHRKWFHFCYGKVPPLRFDAMVEVRTVCFGG